jgi:probable blue pigment (indigoidine) exporter
MVIVLARGLLGTAIRLAAVVAAAADIRGVALLVLGPNAALPVGIAAGLGGSASMSAGTVLSRRWQPSVPPLTVTAWQLTTGGLILVLIALIAEPPLRAWAPPTHCSRPPGPARHLSNWRA